MVPPPTTLCPRLPPAPFIPAWAFWFLQVAFPVNHTFRFGSPSTAYTSPVIHCLPLCPFHPSSVLQASIGPGLLIPPPPPPPPPPHFTLLLPSTNPPTPLYLTHKTPPTLTHWWFSTWRAQPRHPTDGSPPLTHKPINLQLPTPQPYALCTLTSTPDLRTHGIII